MIKNYKTNIAKIIVLLLVVAPIPAAFARPSPHALRSLVLVIPLIIIVTLGLIKLWENKKRWSYATIVLLFFFAIFEFSQYMHLYYVHYPMITALDWGAEYKQLVTEATKQQKKYDYIVINTSLYNPEYIQFYNNKLVYQYVENSWQKPQAWEGKKVLYINSPEEKYNKYLKKIPHKQVTDIHYPNLNNDIFAEFWEI
jgi:hypothetical protein